MLVSKFWRIPLFFLISILGSQGQIQNKVDQLVNLTSTSAMANLNGHSFRQLSSKGNRPYSLVVMFTALASHRECSLCIQAFHQFHLVAQSFKSSHPNSTSLFFAMLDFDSGPDVFQIMKINTAPVFMHFPPNNKPKIADIMDIQKFGFPAEMIARWAGDRAGVKIVVMHPYNYPVIAIFASLALLMVLLLCWRGNSLDFLNNKSAWSFLALLFVFAMLSGQMWNHIRKPPLLHVDPKGGMVFVHKARQLQFLVETYLVMMIYGASAVCFILVTEAADVKGDVRRRKTLALISLVFFSIFFSTILSMFKSKAGQYPFSFLFK